MSYENGTLLEENDNYLLRLSQNRDIRRPDQGKTGTRPNTYNSGRPVEISTPG